MGTWKLDLCKDTYKGLEIKDKAFTYNNLEKEDSLDKKGG